MIYPCFKPICWAASCWFKAAEYSARFFWWWKKNADGSLRVNALISLVLSLLRTDLARIYSLNLKGWGGVGGDSLSDVWDWREKSSFTEQVPREKPLPLWRDSGRTDVKRVHSLKLNCENETPPTAALTWRVHSLNRKRDKKQTTTKTNSVAGLTWKEFIHWSSTVKTKLPQRQHWREEFIHWTARVTKNNNKNKLSGRTDVKRVHSLNRKRDKKQTTTKNKFSGTTDVKRVHSLKLKSENKTPSMAGLT